MERQFSLEIIGSVSEFTVTKTIQIREYLSLAQTPEGVPGIHYSLIQARIAGPTPQDAGETVCGSSLESTGSPKPGRRTLKKRGLSEAEDSSCHTDGPTGKTDFW